MSTALAFGSISLQQIRAFVSVAETSSFTAAGTDLNLTQSAVSVLIRDLETELGLRLFDRTTRSVRLTEPGREMLPAARRVLVDLHAAVSTSRELATKKRGRVRIAATPMFASLLLPDVILQYRQRFPGVDVVVLDRAAGSIARLVAEGEADLGVGTLPSSDSLLAWDLLIDDDVVLVYADGHPLAKRRSISWQDLTRHTYIAISPENGTRQIVDAYTAAAEVTLQPAYEVASVWTLLGMVRSGLGFGLATGYVRMLSPLYDVQIRRLEGSPIERPVGLLRHRHRSLPPAAASFREFIRTAMAGTRTADHASAKERRPGSKRPSRRAGGVGAKAAKAR